MRRAYVRLPFVLVAAVWIASTPPHKIEDLREAGASKPTAK
jgi:hypothetical protein